MDDLDVLIVGGGVAGLTAGVFTARAEFTTRLVNFGSSILNRNAHLENFPGFPAGISPRLFLELLEEQYEETGGDLHQGKVTSITSPDNGFLVEYSGQSVRVDKVICASWSDVSYLSDMDVQLEERDGKRFIETDRWGRSSVSGLYAAGRVCGAYHQAVVASGSGATTAITLLEDSNCDFYHDWVTPDGYFTGREREVPAGCEEIPHEEWQDRSRQSKLMLKAILDDHDQSHPKPHPSQNDSSPGDGGD